jgi:hypothetical protein
VRKTAAVIDRGEVRVTIMTACFIALVLLALTAGVAPAQPQGYRWVDDQGNVGYAGRRDQVPERYRDQLPSEKAGEKPKLGSAPANPPERSVGKPVSAECILRFRGTEKRPGSSRSFPDCDACNRALKGMGGEDTNRAECVATSVESYR